MLSYIVCVDSPPPLCRPLTSLVPPQNDYEKPLTHVHFRAEGDMEFRTLLYIPERAPPNFLNDYYGNKAQLKLYVRRVFISDDFEELIPRHASTYSTACRLH